MTAIGVHTICIGYQQTTKVAASKCLNETNTLIIGLSKTIAIATSMFRFLFIYLFIYFVFLEKQIDGQTKRRATDGQTGQWRYKCTDRQSNRHTDKTI